MCDFTKDVHVDIVKFCLQITHLDSKVALKTMDFDEHYFMYFSFYFSFIRSSLSLSSLSHFICARACIHVSLICFLIV